MLKSAVSIMTTLFVIFNCNSFARNLINWPESVAYDSLRKCYYVANTADGSLIKIDSLGIQTRMGSNPGGTRGITIVGDTLFGTAGTQYYVGFDLNTGEKVIYNHIPGTIELNDCTADTSGYLYITDKGVGSIYRIRLSDFFYEVIFAGLTSPNGIFFDRDNNRILSVSFAGSNARIYGFNLPDFSGSVLKTTSLSYLDGIAEDRNGFFYISCFWGTSSVHRFNNDFTDDGEVVSSGHDGPADICYNIKDDILGVPNYYSSTVDLINMNVTIDQDTDWGFVPQEVNFSGITEHSVTSWLWDFGDGDTSTEENPSHIFDETGVFRVELQITTADSTYRASSLIGIAADTLKAEDIIATRDSIYEVTIYADLKLPTYQIVVPVEYSGDVNLAYKGYETAGCLAENIESISYPNYDANNKRFTLDLSCSLYSYLEPCSGPLIKLKFEVLSTDSGMTSLILDGYNDKLPLIFSSAADYQPAIISGSIYFETDCCLGVVGNIDCSAEEEPDISDITRLIDYLYISHAELCCLQEADANVSGGEPDISDITRLIDYLYITHDPLAACPQKFQDE